MKFVSRCVFLKLNEGKSKSGKDYMNVDLLDEEYNSDNYFIFNEDLQKRFKEANFVGLKDRLDVAFETYKTDNGYGLRVLDFKKLEEIKEEFEING